MQIYQTCYIIDSLLNILLTNAWFFFPHAPFKTYRDKILGYNGKKKKMKSVK